MADLNDFTTVNDTLKDNNAAEAKRDSNLNKNIGHLKKVVEDTGKLQARVAVEAHHRAIEATEDAADRSFTPPSVKAEKDADDDAKHGDLQKALGKIGGGLSKMFDNAKKFVGDTPSLMNAFLMAGGFFLLAEFLQSDMAASVVTTIIDSLTQLFGDIATLSKDFTVGGLIDLIKNNFLTLISILTLLKPKLMFNLAKKAIMGMASMFDGAANFFKEGGMDKILDSVGGSLKGMKAGLSNYANSLKDGFGNFTKNMKNNVKKFKEFGLEGGFDKKLLESVQSFKTSFGNGIKGFTTSFGKGFDAVKGGLVSFGGSISNAFGSLSTALTQPGGLKKIMSAAKLAMGAYFTAMKAAIVGSFSFLLGLIMANPITAIIVAVVAILAGIGAYFGIFDGLFESIGNMFASVVDVFRSLYNYFAESALGKLLGLTPIAKGVEKSVAESDSSGADLNQTESTSGMTTEYGDDYAGMVEGGDIAKSSQENALTKSGAAAGGTGDTGSNTVITNAPTTISNSTNQTDIEISDTDRLFQHLTNMTI